MYTSIWESFKHPTNTILPTQGSGVAAYCAVAIFEDLRFAYGTGSCWRKRLPLSNGRLDKTTVARSALIMILKSSELTSGRGKQNKAIIILSVLLGPSLFFFVSVAAISLVF